MPRRWWDDRVGLAQHLIDHLPGDHQPGQPLLDPGQTLSQHGDPSAQLLCFRSGRRLPTLQFIDQRPHQASSLPLPKTVEASRRQQ